jgi:uracil phosphoribosyltransferase
MNRIHEIEHPLVKHHLAALRDKATPPAEFRRIMRRLSTLLAYEATKELQLRHTGIETPLTDTEGQVLSQRIGLIPILRAGLGLVDPVLDLIPDAEVWHLGFYRDEKTLRPVEYYKKLPPGDPVDVALVLDPMLATGGSAIAALEAVTNWGVPDIKLLAMIAAPEGLDAVQEKFPDTDIFVCAIDAQLNDQGYIVPGLGDAGDRTFNARAV